MTVEKRGNKYCVVHGHEQKSGSKTDKPKGSVIKCFDNPTDAYAMHYAIVKSQERGDNSYSFTENDAEGKLVYRNILIGDYK